MTRDQTAGDPLVTNAFQGLITDPAEHAGRLQNLPRTLPELVRVLQGVLLLAGTSPMRMRGMHVDRLGTSGEVAAMQWAAESVGIHVAST